MTTFINNRYKVTQELGQGGMASVYLVEDTAQNNKVMALKQIQADLLGPRNLAQFKYEFAALKALKHPNLVTVYDFETLDDAKLCYFTMVYVPGRDLNDLARSHYGSKDFTWLYEIIVQTCRALQYIHARGLIHYDIKPHNIRCTPDGQVKLMDFGLIDKATDEVHLSIRGTPEYMAPELIRGHQVDHRVDLYALGVTLYEVLTGHLPFTEDSTAAILKQHLETKPEPPQNSDNSIPPALQTFVLTLMAKTPLKRFNDAHDVIKAVNQISGLNFPLKTKETKKAYLQSARFIGREEELTHLYQLFNRIKRTQGRLALISGEAGVGKTRLIRELKLKAQLEGILVFEGLCQPQAPAPYQPWLTILSQAIAYQQRHQPDSLQVYAALLTKLLPGLQVDLKATPILSTINIDKNNFLEAAARLFQITKRPLLIILDDLHHADPETLNLLNHLGQYAPQNKWLLCGLYRDEDIAPTHPIKKLTRRARLINPQNLGLTPVGHQPYDRLHLLPFNSADIAAFVQSMLGVSDLPEGLVTHLLDDTGGNVRFIESVMHNLLEQDGLKHNESGWHIDFDKLHDIPSNIKEAAQRSLARLSEESLNLLQWGAVIGNTVDLDVLAAVCGLEAANMVQLIAQAQQQYILHLSEQAGENRYRFNNEHLREAIYNTIPADQLAPHHAQVGEALRARYDDTEIAEALAWHFDRAGDTLHALKYAKQAADKARAIYANDLAIQQYSHALKLIDSLPNLQSSDVKYAVLNGRETCYGLVGNLQAQKDDLNTMIILAQAMKDTQKQIQATIRQARLYVLIGDYKDALERAKNALTLVEAINAPKLKADSLLVLGWVSYYLGDGANVIAHCEQAIQLQDQVNDKLGKAESLRWLAAQTLRNGQLKQAKTHFEEAYQICRDLGNRKGEADALNGLGVCHLSIDIAQSRRYYEQSLKIVESIGDRYGQSRGYNNLGIVNWSIGLYNRARDNLQQALQIARDMENRANMNAYMETLGRIYFSLEDYAQAQITLQEGLAFAEETGDQFSCAIYKLMMGRVALVRKRFNVSKDMFEKATRMLETLNAPGEQATVLSWLSINHLALDDWETAKDYSYKALEELSIAGGKSNEYPTQDIWWNHYQVLKANPENASNEGIDDEAWQALQEARKHMLDAITTLSDEGLRRNYLNKVEINRNIIAEWTRQVRRRGHTGESAVEAITLLSAEPDNNTPAQVEERLKRVLDISRRMSEIHEVDTLLNYTMDEVIELTGAERSFLVLIDEAGRPEFKVMRGLSPDEVEEAQNQISYSVIGTVAQSLEPVLLQDALTSERFSRQSSVLDLNLRSVLCVPLVSRGQLIGVIYLDNRAVSGRFTQADVDLMTIFASQAAIAIENTRLYKELGDWAHTLEARVQKRTKELEKANSVISHHIGQLEISNKVGQQVASILNLEALLSAVVKLIQESFGYYFVGVWLLTRNRDTLELRAFSGQMPAEAIKIGYTIPIHTPSITVRACLSGQAQLVNDVHENHNYLALTALPDTLSELALPLQQHDETLGVLNIQSNKANSFSTEDELVLQTLSNQIAIAINNAKLYKSEQGRRHLAESLERTSRALTSTLDMKQVPNLILEQLAIVAPYERGSLLLQTGNVLHAFARRGFPSTSENSDLIVPIRPGDVFQQVVESQSYLIIDDVTAEPGWKQLPWLPNNYSWLGAPIIAKDNVIGLFSLTRVEKAAFSSEDGALVQAFAAQAAVALENARLYQEITKLKNQLEEKVKERTRELNIAYHNLERLDSAKSDFIKVTSHELRTPLTVIDGYTQLLQFDPAITNSKGTKELLEGVLEGTQRMLVMINTILDVTRIDSEILELSKNETHLNDLVAVVDKQLKDVLATRNLSLSYENLDDLPPIQADADLLFKAFYQVITNAIKYTPDGGEVSVTGRIIDEETPPQVEIVISDTGIGIDPGDLSLIFEKFYQTGEVALHSSGKTSYKGGGPGLGLAIAKGVVLGHGGEIWAESEGQDEKTLPGSHFYIRLPVDGG